MHQSVYLSVFRIKHRHKHRLEAQNTRQSAYLSVFRTEHRHKHGLTSDVHQIDAQHSPHACLRKKPTKKGPRSSGPQAVS